MDRMLGKIVLISGGARGLGAAVVRAFVAEGASVVVGDVLVDAGEALADELPRTTFVKLDVTSELDWADAVARTEELHGALHVLVNNAGIRSTGALGEFRGRRRDQEPRRRRGDRRCRWSAGRSAAVAARIGRLRGE